MSNVIVLEEQGTTQYILPADDNNSYLPAQQQNTEQVSHVN